MTLLITGFGPFPGVPVNPTEALVTALAAAFPREVQAVILPTEWGVLHHLTNLAAEANTVLMFGVASRARRTRYERMAWPEATQSPDDQGLLPDHAPRRTRYSRLPVRTLAAEATKAGFSVDISSNPGRYICNAGYSAALAGNPRTLFVHVPMPDRRGLTPHVEHGAFLVDRLAAAPTLAGQL